MTASEHEHLVGGEHLLADEVAGVGRVERQVSGSWTMVTFSAMAVFTSSATLCAVAGLMCMGSVFIGITKGKFSDANALALKSPDEDRASTDQPSLPSTTGDGPILDAYGTIHDGQADLLVDLGRER